jgi:hypothetical protein
MEQILLRAELVASWEGEKRANSPIRKLAWLCLLKIKRLEAFHSRLLPGAHPPAPRFLFLPKVAFVSRFEFPGSRID